MVLFVYQVIVGAVLSILIIHITLSYVRSIINDMTIYKDKQDPQHPTPQAYKHREDHQQPSPQLFPDRSSSTQH